MKIGDKVVVLRPHGEGKLLEIRSDPHGFCYLVLYTDAYGKKFREWLRLEDLARNA